MADVWNHQFAQVNGVRLHYVRQGSGAPVVLVHGWPGFWFEWNKNIPALAERFDVVAPDMRGYAYSDKPDLPPEEGYTDAVMANDLAALVRSLGFERVSMVAHDFGAAWAQRFARDHGDLLEKLVLFDPPYPGIGGRWFQMPQFFEVWYMIFHQQPWAEDVVGATRASTETYLRHFLRHWSHDTDVFSDEEIAEFVEAYSQPRALRGGFNCYRATFRTAGQQRDESPISTPTLVLWADSDPILPFAWSDNLSRYFHQPHAEEDRGLRAFHAPRSARAREPRDRLVPGVNPGRHEGRPLLRPGPT
ncbi:MAG: alpha/beta hydrolase [Dehalococcoidia bacterium]|nr:alpha/beta hydrolase [Dehalococcoidia bacterium]